MNIHFSGEGQASKEKRVVFTSNTTELKQLIKQADSSGKAAWTAGKMLKEIKEQKLYLVKYNSFEKYVREEFRINEVTANTYIKVHEKFGLKEIGELIVSNLKVLAEIGNEKLRKEVVTAFSGKKNADYKVKDVIATVALLNHDKQKFSKVEISELITKVIKQSRKDEADEKQKRKLLVKFGEPIKSEAYNELESLFEKQPINEMGVVALFCVMFNWMRSAPIKLGNDILYFKSIKYVQVGFPDACIVCRVEDKKNSNTDLHVEFEYKSFSYIEHQHHRSDKKCDLIICWEENARKGGLSSNAERIKELPPIIELRDFLKTGKINLK